MPFISVMAIPCTTKGSKDSIISGVKLSDVSPSWSPWVKFLPRFPASKCHLPTGGTGTEPRLCPWTISKPTENSPMVWYQCIFTACSYSYSRCISPYYSGSHPYGGTHITSIAASFAERTVSAVKHSGQALRWAQNIP